jgi:hypothetical protein
LPKSPAFFADGRLLFALTGHGGQVKCSSFVSPSVYEAAFCGHEALGREHAAVQGAGPGKRDLFRIMGDKPVDGGQFAAELFVAQFDGRPGYGILRSVSPKYLNMTLAR